MRIFLLSNTLFGFKNKKCLNTQLGYFNHFLIPFLQKSVSQDDILIHLGNFFDNSQNINVQILNSCQEIFENISQILPIKLVVGRLDKNSESNNTQINTLNVFKNFKNIEIIDTKTTIGNITIIPYTKMIMNDLTSMEEIVLFNSDYKNTFPEVVKSLLKKHTVFCGHYNNYEVDENIINIGAPYQLDQDLTKEKGIVISDLKKHKFLENTISPRYERIEIKTIEDLKSIEEKKDFIEKNIVDVYIDQTLIDEKKLKIELTLSKYKFNKIEYKAKEEVDEPHISFESYEIDNMIYEQLQAMDNSTELIKEFDYIKKLKQSAKTK